MYDYHYNVTKAHYKDSITLMFTDTDLLAYHVWTDNFYHNLSTNSNLLNQVDTANLPSNHPSYVSARKRFLATFLTRQTDV